MRASRVFRLIFRIFIYLLTISVTTVSFLGLMSAINIFSPNSNNIGIDEVNREFNIKFDIGGLQDVNFTQPFNITNAGYFDIENFMIRIELAMNYTHVNVTPGVNGTRTVKIFDESINFGKVPRGQTGIFNFTGLYTDFDVGIIPNITQIDIFKTPPILEFYANFTISLDYSFGMHSIAINILNIKIHEINSIIP
ncbi:MAG: hypothetical protein ACFFD7_04195 [Candidatus Thorarchaeota archaeon]